METSHSFVDPQVALDKLATFENADDLADFLIDQDVHGDPLEYNACPIAVWLQTTTGHYAKVSPAYISSPRRKFRGRRTTAVETQFVRNFDNGHYPTLTCEEESYA